LVPLADWTGTHHELHPKSLREIHTIYSIHSLIRGITNCFCEFNLSLLINSTYSPENYRKRCPVPCTSSP
jgi:hypothetical protein